MLRFLFILLIGLFLLLAEESQGAAPYVVDQGMEIKDKVALLPYPVHVDWKKDFCTFTSVRFDMGVLGCQKWSDCIVKEYQDITKNLDLPSVSSPLKEKVLSIILQSRPSDCAEDRGEGYTLTVTADSKIIISASDFGGYFNALQTLRQLILRCGDAWVVPCCDIRDLPAFPVRGIMLDVGRYYLSPAFIKTLVRDLSRYKINTLHLHLTDDPGWRVWIDKYPGLTDGRNHWPTRRPGKYYTREELRDLVAYCAALNVQVIPEIDMPGHSAVFSKAIAPMQTERGLLAVKEVLDETIPLFPSPLFHIGSDEVHVTMPEFVPSVIKHVVDKGKTPVVWYPGSVKEEDKAIFMCWGENESGAGLPETGKYIDSNGFYMDWMDSQSGVYQIWFQQPCGVPESNERALGSVLAVWCDGALSGENRILEQYPFYPCALTFAERVWRGNKEKRREFMANLPQKGTPEWKKFSDFEDRLIIHRDRYFSKKPFAYVKQADMEWLLIGPFNHQGKNDTSFEPEKIIKDTYTSNGKTLGWKKTPAVGGAVHIRSLYAMFNQHQKRYRLNHWPTLMSPDVGKEPGTCYALTHVYSPGEQDVHLMFGLNGMWGHSGGYRSSRAPEQGSWDYSGGDVWLNGKRINPPEWPFKSLPWGGWGKGRIEEAPLTQEGYFFRPPVPIHLKKGWNKILIRSVSGPWKGDSADCKWMFACMPVLWDGVQYTEIPGLKYSAQLSR